MRNNRDDDRWQDDDPEPVRKGREGKAPAPPFLSIILWILVFSLIPVAVLLLREKDEETALTQSEFRSAMLQHRITEAQIRLNSSGGDTTIVGKFRPTLTAQEQNFRAQVVYTDNLDREVQANITKVSVKPVSNLVSHLLLSVVPFIVIIALLYFFFSRQMRNAGRGALQFGRSRARLAQNLDKVTFADVAGIDSAKDEVIEVVEYLRDPAKFHRLGGRIPHGVILVGPPGTGKTLLARAIAGEADVPFFTISGSDFVEMFVGVGASRVRDMFDQAKRNTPCIVFIDEIDAVGRSRFTGMGGGHDEREQTLNALLVEMDGFEPNSGVIVTAATNRPDVLDKALLRPGRFDRQVHVHLPDLVGRRQIIDVHVKKIKLGPDIDLDAVARSTPGFSGADLANLINEAALLAARRNRDGVLLTDFEEARDKVMFGKERPWRAMSERDRRLTACHEAGHALVSLYCTHADPLHKVSIIPRGKMLGGAMYFPEGDKVSQSQSELSEQMVIAVAGRSAEQLLFNEVNSGVYADVHHCSLVARAMVAKLGMSPKLGFIEYATTDADMGYLGLLSRPEYSEETARVIDDEVRRLVGDAMTRATALLTEHRDQLEKLTDALLERETLNAEEVCDLLGMPLPPRLAALRRAQPPAAKTPPDAAAAAAAATTPPAAPPVAPPAIGAPPPVGLAPKPGA